MLLKFFITASLASLAVGDYVFKLHLMYYYNPSGRERDGSCCDTVFNDCGSYRCDHVIRFCLDEYREDNSYRNDFNYCSLYMGTSERFSDSHRNNLMSMRNIPNPIILSDESWFESGKIVLKVYVRDHDHWKLSNQYTEVDRLLTDIAPTWHAGQEKAVWSEVQRVDGLRSGSKTSLELRHTLYCTENYYGPKCDVFCLAQDSAVTGHYTCDPLTGQKLCRIGWEDPLIHCKRPDDDCRMHHCQNGQCVDGDRRYSCACDPGYTGVFCDVEINECSSSPCVADNTYNCIDSNATFICRCKPGFTGHTCAYHGCDNNMACYNGGTCVGNANIECICADGFTGQHCTIDECDSMQCQNGGRCNRGTCFCPSTFTGDLCEVKKDLCEDKICYHGGPCKDGKCTNPCEEEPCMNRGACYVSMTDPTDYLCVCLQKYSGRNCQTVLDSKEPDVIVSDACAQVSCQNGGTCDAGTCQCRTGYTGQLCDDVINNCQTGTCLNGGTCYSNETSYMCVCRYPYTGSNCQSVISNDPCDQVVCGKGQVCDFGDCDCPPGYGGDRCEIIGCNVKPCMNGGSCFYSQSSYTCVCAEPWAGHNCDAKVAQVVEVKEEEEPIPQQAIATWMYALIGVGIFLIVVIILVVALLMARRRKRRDKENAAKGTNTESGSVPPRSGSFDNPSFTRDNVYENMNNQDDYSTQNDLNLNIVPKDGVVYAKPSKKPPLPERSRSYDGSKAQEKVYNKAPGSSKGSSRRGSEPALENPSSIYNYTAGTASGYSYAKVDKTKTDKKLRELKTPKHLEDRYQAMKAATLQNDLKA